MAAKSDLEFWLPPMLNITKQNHNKIMGKWELDKHRKTNLSNDGMTIGDIQGQLEAR